MATNTASTKQTDQQSPLQPVSMPSLDGFNLASLPFFPLKRQAQHLANSDTTFLWTINTDEGEKNCYFRRLYGPAAPNADTVDYLLLLLHLLRISDDPHIIKPNFHEIEMLKPYRKKYKPGRDKRDEIIRHLDALQGLNVHTNAVYDLQQKAWKIVKTNVLNYEYRDKTGKKRKRTLTKILPDGTTLTYVSTEDIGELTEIEFSKRFLKRFFSDTVYLDLGVYFALEDPTCKGLFRFGNRTVQTLGDYECDARHFFWNILGMSSVYVTQPDHPRFRDVISLGRRYAQRIIETEGSGFRPIFERSKTCPSGYKFIVAKPKKVQASLFPSLESFTDRERKSYALLRSYGVYANTAASLVRRYRRRLGREAPDYIQYVVRYFRSKYMKTGRLNTPQHKWGGVLANFFKSDILFPQYADWSQVKRSKQRKLDHSLYEGQVRDLFGRSPSESKENLFLEGFAKQYPDVYRRIVAAVHTKYDQLMSELPPGAMTPYEMKTRKNRSVEEYCRTCLINFDKGKNDYYPPMLADDAGSDE